MSVNLDDLDPTSPEFDAAIEAAQAEEDAALGNAEQPEAGAEPAEQTTETDSAEAAESPAEAQPEPAPTKVAGVVSKDGKHVLPYAALKAERRAAREYREQLERVKAELEALKQGKAAPDEPVDPFSDEFITELAKDIPEVGEMSKALRQMREELAQLKGSKAEPEAAAPSDDPVQEAIDSVPLLAEWQATDAEKFERAKEIDRALQNSPKWRGKSLEDRFEHVARMVADEFDIQVADAAPPTPTNPPAKAKADPREVINSARRAPPNTLSDFKGGAADKGDNIDNLPRAQQRARLATMSNADIEAWLSKVG